MHPRTALGETIVTKYANSSENTGAPSLVTAASTGDASKRTGKTVDRLVNNALAMSAVVSTSYLAALGEGETIKLAHEIQESDDDSNWTTAEVIEAATVKATGGSGGSNEHGVDEHALSLEGRKRYFRINVTPDLSRSGTDTAIFQTQAVLGGFDILPQ